MTRMANLLRRPQGIETIREAAALLLPLIREGIIGDLFQGIFAHLKHPTEFTLTDVRDQTSLAAWERVLKNELDTDVAPSQITAWKCTI
jgi:hypothetical protein